MLKLSPRHSEDNPPPTIHWWNRFELLKPRLPARNMADLLVRVPAITSTRMFEPRHNIFSNVVSMFWRGSNIRPESNRPVPGPLLAELSIVCHFRSRCMNYAGDERGVGCTLYAGRGLIHARCAPSTGHTRLQLCQLIAYSIPVYEWRISCGKLLAQITLPSPYRLHDLHTLILSLCRNRYRVSLGSNFVGKLLYHVSVYEWQISCRKRLEQITSLSP